MTTAHAPRSKPRIDQVARLTVSLINLDVREASVHAQEYLGLTADRLLGRSLLLSEPELGQALTRLLAAGLEPRRVPMNVQLATPDGEPLTAFVRQIGQDAIIELEPAGGHASANHVSGAVLHAGLHQRLDELRRELGALGQRIPCSDDSLRGDDQFLLWLWQAEVALGRLSERCAAVEELRRHDTGIHTTDDRS